MNTNKSIREYRAMSDAILFALVETTKQTIAAADARMDWAVGDAATRELKKIEKALSERL